MARRRRGATSRYFAPLVYHGRDDARRSSFTVVGPLYLGRAPDETRFGIAPLLFTSARQDGWQATLLPLFHAARKPDGGTRLVTLVGGFTTYPGGGAGLVGPLYLRSDERGYAVSLIPLFHHAVDRKAGTSTTVLLPLLFRHATHETSLLGVTPLFWHHRSLESSTTLAFPVYFEHHRHYESRTFGILPLVIRHKDYVSGESSTVIPPLLLYLHQAAEGTDAVFFPLVWRFVGKTQGGAPARTTVLFPLYWDVVRAGSRTQVLFPLFARAHRETAEHTLVLNFYYRRGIGTAEGSYAWNLFPLFDFGRPHPGDLEWNILEGLIGYSRIGTHRALKLLWATEVSLDPPRAPAPTSFFNSSPSARRFAFE